VTSLLIALGLAAVAAGPVEFGSPGFPNSQMSPDGCLVEDWGNLGLRLSGAGLSEGPLSVEAVKLDNLVPAARATSDRGPVRLVATAFRAPTQPAGLDVLVVRVEEAKGAAAEVTLALDLPSGTKIGRRTVNKGGRVVVTLPHDAAEDAAIREWGWCDDAVSLPGWGKPKVACDPAFKNIRAGMGGTPIAYRFAVKPKSEANVVLGLCESHWAEAGGRPLDCRVEGATAQVVDPVAKWGRSQPGALLFTAKDENGDGWLEVSVRSARGAQDRNPILNALWIFPAGKAPKLDEVVAGKLSASAERYVDAGGEDDQCLYPPSKAEYSVKLPAGGSAEWVFLAACKNSAAPLPETTAWTYAKLRRAAVDVWRDWPQP
jgi:hypothetical protein